MEPLISFFLQRWSWNVIWWQEVCSASWLEVSGENSETTSGLWVVDEHHFVPLAQNAQLIMENIEKEQLLLRLQQNSDLPSWPKTEEPRKASGRHRGIRPPIRIVSFYEEHSAVPHERTSWGPGVKHVSHLGLQLWRKLGLELAHGSVGVVSLNEDFGCDSRLLPHVL